MDLLSQIEVSILKRTASSDLYQLFRNCSLAVLNSGSKTDNSKELIAKYPNFDINVLQRERGVKLELINPPEKAFVDGRIIRSLQANLFSVLRDIHFWGLLKTIGTSERQIRAIIRRQTFRLSVIGIPVCLLAGFAQIDLGAPWFVR